MDKKEIKQIDFNKLLQSSLKLPLVHIDRDEFLEKELSKYCDSKIVKIAVENNPAYAGISSKIIDHIAKSSINYETLKVSTISFAAGIPGGFTMAASIPADITQYYAHILRIIQKLAYIYGWQSLIEKDKTIDDETSQILTLFTGVMFGVKGATSVVTKISSSIAQKVGKTLSQKALTKGVIYPIVKKTATMIGVKMTKDIFAKSVSKVIPVVGGVVSGGITFASYKPMSVKFKKYLEKLDLANKEYYEKMQKNTSTSEEPIEFIDIDCSEINDDLP